MSKVREIIAALKGDGWVNVEFAHTAGGVHAIRLDLGNRAEGDYSEILITDDDALGSWNLDSDDQIVGDWWIGSYDGSGDAIGEIHAIENGRPMSEVLPEIVAAVNSLADEAVVYRAAQTNNDSEA